MILNRKKNTAYVPLLICTSFVLVSGVVLTVSGIFSGIHAVPTVSEYTLVEKANEKQKQIMEETLQSIREEETRLNLYYLDLKEYGLINEKNVTFFPLQALFIRNPGSRDRHVLNESAVLYWEGEKIRTVAFLRRDSILGDTAVKRQRMQFNAGNAAGESPVEIISMESLEFSKSKDTSYRFPPSEEPVRDRTDTIIIDGYEKNVKVVYIRDVKTRMKMLIDMRDQMLSLNLRIRIYIDNIKKREIRDAKKALDRK